jgi:hypothetical protein
MQLVRGLFLLGWCCLPLATACAGAQHPRSPASSSAAASGPIHPPVITDADFAAKTYQLLVDGESTRQRTEVLVGVVQHQLRRAGQRFEQGSPSAGLRALLGGLLLVRAGEQRSELVQGGSKALLPGATEVSRLGQEGYSVALYGMLAAVLPPGPARNEVESHLKAIREFSRSTQGGGPLQSAGTLARVAVQRALLEATPEALNDAKERLVVWIKRALDYNATEQPIRTNSDRDEWLEADRGQQEGPVLLTALYIRHGDPRGALSALDGAELERMVAPKLRQHLERAGDEHDPEAWAELYRWFAGAAENGASGFDPELMSGAAWGAALELFRAEPTTLRAAMPIATQLVTHGMSEVAGLLLTSVLSRNSSPPEIGAGLALSLNAIVAEDASGQVEAARRTYAGIGKLLALAEARPFVGKVSPSAARVHYVMAAIETRHAELDRARPLLARAISLEPSIEALTMMAAIERQKKNAEAALAALEAVRDLARRTTDLLAETDALIQRFEVLRDAGRIDAASAALDEALTRAVEAEHMGKPGPSQARVERQLARVLEQYGDQAALRRATQRAYEAANGDMRQLAATVLDTARRALTRGDLALARAAAQRAIDASLGPDEIIYIALWLQLLEKKFNMASDGTVEEAYATIDESSRWPARLRAWARGRISDADLAASARDPSERTEAAFYSALNEQVSGKPAAARLKDVASSPAIDLVEVTIARDLLAPPQSYKLPRNVAIP